VIDFLMAYLSSELKPGEAALFEEHLGACPECVAYLRTYRQAVEMGKAVCCCPDDPAPEALIEVILAIRPSLSEPPKPPPVSPS
jgi:anti-sigma factor RsiW